MTNILVITTSIFGENGQSSHLVSKALESLNQRYPQAQVTTRDLSSEPVPHLDAERFGAFLAAQEQPTDEQKRIIAYSDELIAELKEADVIVLGVPMYNFGVPSVLKAYFDHIARAGVTFRYTENGPQGLLEDKPVYVLAARGGIYEGTDNDSQTPFIRTFLGFLGLTSVEFVYAEGLALGDEHKAEALDKAETRIAAITA